MSRGYCPKSMHASFQLGAKSNPGPCQRSRRLESGQRFFCLTSLAAFQELGGLQQDLDVAGHRFHVGDSWRQAGLGRGREGRLHHFCYNVTDTVQQTQARSPAPGTPRPRDAQLLAPPLWDAPGPQLAPLDSRGDATAPAPGPAFGRTPGLGTDVSSSLCSVTRHWLLGVSGPQFPARTGGEGRAQRMVLWGPLVPRRSLARPLHVGAAKAGRAGAPAYLQVASCG